MNEGSGLEPPLSLFENLKQCGVPRNLETSLSIEGYVTANTEEQFKFYYATNVISESIYFLDTFTAPLFYSKRRFGAGLCNCRLNGPNTDTKLLIV
jgi:hypothetical protein